MPSSWIVEPGRKKKGGAQNRGRRRRYLVRYRLGGAESSQGYGGSFATLELARARKRWIDGELASMRVPNLTMLVEPVRLPTVRETAAAWKASRIDVAAGTRKTYDTNLDRILPTLGDSAIPDCTPADIAALVAELHARGLKRESIRKTLSTLAQVLDFAKVAREDRNLDGQVLAGLDADAFRTALGRACKAAGVPAFSPHDLRHRRASLWHLGGMPVAEACSKLGHSPQVHLGLYAHVVLDRSELDYVSVLGNDRFTRAPVRAPELEKAR